MLSAFVNYSLQGDLHCMIGNEQGRLKISQPCEGAKVSYPALIGHAWHWRTKTLDVAT